MKNVWIHADRPPVARELNVLQTTTGLGAFVLQDFKGTLLSNVWRLAAEGMMTALPMKNVTLIPRAVCPYAQASPVLKEHHALLRTTKNYVDAILLLREMGMSSVIDVSGLEL